MSDSSGCGWLALLVSIGCLAGWLNHLYVCFNDDRWGFLIAGAIFFPVGVIHGIGLFFGWW